MKKSVALLVLFFFFLIIEIEAQNRSIRFSDKAFTETLAMAKKENKLVFLDAYASWCGPCKWLAATIFRNDTAADFYNNHFICASIDMEKGEGRNIATRYQISLYPTLLFLNAYGDIVHKKVGAPREIRDFVALGEKALKPEECYTAYAKRYANGENSPAFILNYLKNLADAYEPISVPLNKYFATQTDSQLTGNINWQIIYNFSTDIDSREIRYLVANEKEFSKLHGADSVGNKLFDVYITAMLQYTRSRTMTQAGYEQMKKKVLSSGYKGAEKAVFTADLNYYQMKGDKTRFLELAYGSLDKYYRNDNNMLSGVALAFSSLTKERKYLEKAAQWSKRSVELKPEVSAYETYAAILFDLGKKEEAIKYCRTALALAREKNLPTSGIEDQLKKYDTAE